MNVWKTIDRIGHWIATKWTPVYQVRTGVVITVGGIILIPVGLIAGEPPLIYEMSAFALVLGGLGIVITAVLALKEDPDTSEQDLDPRQGDE